MNKLIIASALILLCIISNVCFAQEGPNRPPPERPTPPNPDTPLPGRPPIPQGPQPPINNSEQRLRDIIVQQNIVPINTSEINVLPVEHEKVQLGKKLFFTKNLGGEQSVACVSCHHPLLGGGDNLSLSVGVNAVDEFNIPSDALLGLGRFNGNNNHPVVPRNAPTLFNIALYSRGLFWDSRVERVRNGAIVTPDSITDANGRRQPDRNLPNDASLVDAQARFPVTSQEEMRGEFLANINNQELRNALTARLNNEILNISTNWPIEFSQVYSTQEVTSNRIFEAIAEYERSMLFVNNPWQQYLSGNALALTEQQKQGAILFFTPSQQGGAGCAACHNGTNFTDSRHHLVAFPQIGVGKGNTSNTSTSQDFGRENVTNNSNDKFHFRTPSLLNVAVTAPYGHSGAYQSLEEVVAHYNNPRSSIERLYSARNGQPFSEADAPYCRLPQIQTLMTKNNINCDEVFADSFENSLEVANYLQDARANRVTTTAAFRARTNLSPIQIQQVVDFLNALTDPCVEDRECLTPWLLNENDIATFPDDQPLEAINAQRDTL